MFGQGCILLLDSTPIHESFGSVNSIVSQTGLIAYYFGQVPFMKSAR